jgi:hypothetical protein
MVVRNFTPLVTLLCVVSSTLLFSGCNLPTSESTFGITKTKLNPNSALSTTLIAGSQPSASPTPSVSISPTSTPSSTSLSQLATYLCPDSLACLSRYMPLLDQTDSSLGTDLLPQGGSKSQLCGPVSGTMVLTSYLKFKEEKLPQIQVLGWTLNSFQNKTWQTQVKNMATLMSTDPATGTIFYSSNSSKGVGLGVAGRTSDFTQGMVIGTTSTFGIDFTEASSLFSKLKAGNAIELNYGHYTGTKYNNLGISFTTFTREGGHLVALRGWSNSRLVLNDPWKAVVSYTYLGKLFQSSDTDALSKNTSWLEVPSVALPNSLKSAAFLVYLQQGNYYPIIEGYSSILMIPSN